MSSYEALKRELNTILGSSYYFERAPGAAEYPYRVGSFGPSYDDISAEVLSFELDYWGNSNADIEDDIAADLGNGDLFNSSGLNYKRINKSDVSAFITFDGRVNVPDPDRDIKHVRVSYTIRLYHTGG